MMQRSSVLPNRTGPDEAEFHAKLIAGLARVAANITPARLAKAMGRTTRQLANIMGGSTPEAPAIFDALLADPTALDELLAGYGFRLCPNCAEPANDLTTAAGIITAAGELVRAVSDGYRDHNETLAVATLLRPHMAAMTAIVREADALRGAA